MKTKTQQYLKGAVSIYVVIFTALIVSIITVSFIRIMVSNEHQSSNADLSQSARDSALAGVEDAKIALLKYIKQCPSGKNSDTGSTNNCQEIYKRITGDCNYFHGYMDGSNAASANTEVIVQRNDSNKDSDKALQQAYTCVKIQVETDDYLGVMSAGKSDLIPLIPEANPSDPTQPKTIDSVELSWYTIGDNSGKMAVSDPKHAATADGLKLDQSNSDWGINAPSLMRVQLIQTDTSFKLQDLDDQGSGSLSDRGTIFLYPRAVHGPETVGATPSFDINPVYALGASSAYNMIEAPVSVSCFKDFKYANGYACTAKVKLPNTFKNSINRKNTFIRLTSYYHDQTNYKMVMKSGNSTVKFDGVQPAVDSTGRASDLYRRVEARVQLFGDAIFPEFAVDMSQNGEGTGQFCKMLTVTDKSNIEQGGNTSYTPCPE